MLQIVPFTNLVEVTSGIESKMYTVNGIVYTRHRNVDSRYSKMDPIVCFTPNTVSAIPSVLPTSAPTSKTVAFIRAVQVQLNLIPTCTSTSKTQRSLNSTIYLSSTCIFVFNPSDYRWDICRCWQ